MSIPIKNIRAERITGSLDAIGINISGSLSGSFSGSLQGTASFATNALTASFVSSTSNAFIQNGNSFGTTALLGTNDNQSLAFETSGSTRMFISSSGNVGIGTTTPSASIDVVGGNILVNYQSSYGSRNSINNIVPVISVGTGTMSGLNQSNLYKAGYANTNGFEIGVASAVGIYGIDSDGTNVKTFGIYTNNIRRLTIDSSGSLRVSGSASITGSLTVTQGITGSLFGTSSWANNSISTSFSTNANNVNISTQDTTPTTYNVTFTEGASGMNNLNIDTTALRYTPSTSTFETPIVNSTTAVRGGNGSAASPAFSFSGDTNTGIYNIAADTLGFATSGSERMRINSSGYVSIGNTTSPALLQVGPSDTVSSLFVGEAPSVNRSGGYLTLDTPPAGGGDYGIFDFTSVSTSDGDSFGTSQFYCSAEEGFYASSYASGSNLGQGTLNVTQYSVGFTAANGTNIDLLGYNKSNITIGTYSSSGGDINLLTRSTSSLYIDTAQRVGIGKTTGINAKLDVNGDVLINGLTVGRGGGSLSSNTTIGINALSSNSSGQNIIAVGRDAVKDLTNVDGLTVIGVDANRKPDLTDLESNSIAINQFNPDFGYGQQVPHFYAPDKIYCPKNFITDLLTIDYSVYTAAFLEYSIYNSYGDQFRAGRFVAAFKGTGTPVYQDYPEVVYIGTTLAATFTITGGGGNNVIVQLENYDSDNYIVRFTSRLLMR